MSKSIKNFTKFAAISFAVLNAFAAAVSLLIGDTSQTVIMASAYAIMFVITFVMAEKDTHSNNYDVLVLATIGIMVALNVATVATNTQLATLSNGVGAAVIVVEGIFNATMAASTYVYLNSKREDFNAKVVATKTAATKGVEAIAPQFTKSW